MRQASKLLTKKFYELGAMMAILHVHVKVQDYRVWRTVFDETANIRESFGCQSETILVNASDEKDIIVILSFDDFDAAKAFSQSSQLREGMQRAGVIPPPQITFLEER